MFRIILASALVAISTATPAFAELARTPQQISAAVKQGCTVQHLYAPSGKGVHEMANVYCAKTAPIEVAKADIKSRDTRRIAAD